MNDEKLDITDDGNIVGDSNSPHIIKPQDIENRIVIPNSVSWEKFKITLSEWLDYFNLRASPFESQSAEYEDPETWVTTPGFSYILGSAKAPQSILVFASRGGGKTTCRRLIEYYCSPKAHASSETEGCVLAVPYDDFYEMSMAFGEGEEIDSRWHIEQILKRISYCLIEYIQENDELKQQLQENDGGLAQTARQTLFSFLETYLSRESQHENLKNLFPGVKSGVLDMTTKSPIERLDDFLSLLCSVGDQGLEFDAIYILVDSLDRIYQTASLNADVALERLLSLISNKRLVYGTPQMALKCFIPKEIRERLREHPAMKNLNLRIAEITWHPSTIIDMLHRRLISYKKEHYDGSFTRIEELCTPELRDIGARLFSVAKGNPRDTLRLCDFMVEAHIIRSVSEYIPSTIEEPFLLNELDWRDARKKFLRQKTLRKPKTNEELLVKVDVPIDGFLNVFSQPTTSSHIVTKVKHGEYLTAVGSDYSVLDSQRPHNEWVKVRLPNGNEAYTLATYLNYLFIEDTEKAMVGARPYLPTDNLRAGLEKLSTLTYEALLWAEGLRRATGAFEVYSVYVLIGLYKKDNFTHRILNAFYHKQALNRSLRILANRIMATNIHLSDVKPAPPSSLQTMKFSPNTARAINLAFEISNQAIGLSFPTSFPTSFAERRDVKESEEVIEPSHLLAGLLAVPESGAATWLAEMLGVDCQTLYKLLLEASYFPVLLDLIQKASSRVSSEEHLDRNTPANIEFVVDNLLDLDVDAIVNAVGTDSMRAGMIGQQLASRLGPKLYESLQKQRSLKLGEALATNTEGLIPARYVIHACTEVSGGRHTLISIAQGTVAALEKAEALDLRTIAFPAIGSGAAGFQAKRVAPQVLNAMLDYLEQGSRLEKVIFVFVEEEKYRIYTDVYESLRSKTASTTPSDSAKAKPLYYLDASVNPTSGPDYMLALSFSSDYPGQDSIPIEIATNELHLRLQSEGFIIPEGEDIVTLTLLDTNESLQEASVRLTPRTGGRNTITIEPHSEAKRYPALTITVDVKLSDLYKKSVKTALPDPLGPRSVPLPDVVLRVYRQPIDHTKLRLEYVLYSPKPNLHLTGMPVRSVEVMRAQLKSWHVRLDRSLRQTQAADIYSGLSVLGHCF